MPTPVDLVRQCLTEAAARVLDEAVAVARRRSHARTTSLHVVSALLAPPSSTLRDACACAMSFPYNSRLQFRALELSVGVALDRLQSSRLVERPPISNSLTAAIKRGQANQRRNPENYHLQLIHCNQQSASLLKVELKYFILSILDDPIVNRVFGDAGFQSFEIKRAILQPPVAQLSPKFPRTPRFLCNLTDSGLGPDSVRAGLSLPLGFADVDESCRRIGEVFVERHEKKGRNPLLVGVYANKALRGFIENVTSRKLGVLPKEIYGMDVICIEREISKFVLEKGSEEIIALRFKELETAVEQCSGPGVLVNFGELKALVGDNVSSEAVKFVVSKLTSLLEMNSGNLWLIGAVANYEAYSTFSNVFPSIEKDWNLQLLPIHFKSSLMGSFVPFGGFFSLPLEPKSLMRSKNQYNTSCYLCNEKFEHEVGALLKGRSITSVADQCSEKLSSSLEMAEFDTRKGVDMVKVCSPSNCGIFDQSRYIGHSPVHMQAKEDGTALHAEVLELRKKWNDNCQLLHHTQVLPKLRTPETRSQVLNSRVFITDTKESGSKDPTSNENLSGNLNPIMNIDLQKIMEQETSNGHTHSHIQSDSQHDSVPSSFLSPISTSRVQEDNDETQQQQQQQQQQEQQQASSTASYHINISISDVARSGMRDGVWSCLVVLVTFWFFASMTMILGIYGSVDLQLGPNYSRLIQTNSIFVQSIKVEELDQQSSGSLILYGFHKPPPLDVEITWTETHNAVVQVDLHEEWLYYLNKGSNVDISYRVISPSTSPLSLVIAQGSESLEEWIDDPSYPNTTLSWDIIHGSGKIQQEISESSTYYIAVGNLNSHEVEVQLNFTISAFIYNTTKAYYKCSLGSRQCSFTLPLVGANTAVLTSPGPTEGSSNAWYVKLSYGPRWIAYFVGSGVMTILILLAFRFLNVFQSTSGNGTGIQAGDMTSERAPLLSNKDDDLSSWGSSYDSVSHDDEDLDEWLAVKALKGNLSYEGENNSNPGRLCVICCDSPRDCFFLPCGHCAACFTCGTRIAEEAGTCPICRRKMKKVRKIFSV
ncbi:protein SMAX1-LIKE 6-like isoform X4 [Mangifera indica]|uniref:protein SMAX1-LIKE 6-like isoform X4 n=1 Tax=Mangifera indica TaxID=29780 RepID=UPI001CF98BEA|nr:protein SMAX1-LIKE 6-like isoform X4 [Mangifera indica]